MCVVGVIFYWTDPRLAGWPNDTKLPPRLWAPYLFLENRLGDMQERDINFLLDDPATGRMKRTRMYAGSIDNPMELRNFPFDLDRIELSFWSYGTWSTAA
eukprot:SAG11_NODE_6676_length_1269_cov_1.089744_2_plen_99_part_01